MEKNKLISVVIPTYNSSKYIIDTLESVKAQDYKDIELIVGDNCSTDNTFELCQKWMAANAKRFVRTAVVKTAEKGICANFNHALQEVSGEWVKRLDSDDLLMPDCISAFVEATKINSDKLMVCGTLHFLDGETDTEPRMLPKSFGSMTTTEQRRFFVKEGTVIEGPTFFLETETFRNGGGTMNDIRTLMTGRCA